MLRCGGTAITGMAAPAATSAATGVVVPVGARVHISACIQQLAQASPFVGVLLHNRGIAALGKVVSWHCQPCRARPFPRRQMLPPLPITVGLALAALAVLRQHRRRRRRKADGGIPEPFPWYYDLVVAVTATGDFPGAFCLCAAHALSRAVNSNLAGLRLPLALHPWMLCYAI